MKDILFLYSTALEGCLVDESLDMQSIRKLAISL
jgi:hypothetical protein